MNATDPRPAGPFEQLTELVCPLREQVTSHAIYRRLSDLLSLRIFMENHVFAVWDFMSLLKALQRRLTCVTHPWLPPPDTITARLINEIVLNEETDQVAPGRYIGHFHLYLAAMQEVDADTRAIRDLIASLRRGVPLETALQSLPILESTRRFVRGNLQLTYAPVHQLAAAFLFGREELVPAMFTSVLSAIEGRGARCDAFRCYLERHVVLDSSEHAGMARCILESLCGQDATRWREAIFAAMEALESRRALWDGILEAMGAAA